MNADCGEICGVCGGGGGSQYASTAAQRDAELAMVENVVETVPGVGKDSPIGAEPERARAGFSIRTMPEGRVAGRRWTNRRLLSILSYNAAVDAIA